jgi:peptide-methionine (S)-S-oxide reductase
MTQNEVAVFGGGCFWCTEAVFQRLKGVTSVMPGYAGGSVKDPNYYEVCDGSTGHAEVIKLEFDPTIITYTQLLEVFFAVHNPTTLNKQGADVGTQYRSIILYSSEEQKMQAETYIKSLTQSGEFTNPIVTQVEKLDTFYTAETYHQKYFDQNQDQPYCEIVISPKLKHFQEKFPQLLKSH